MPAYADSADVRRAVDDARAKVVASLKDAASARRDADADDGDATHDMVEVDSDGNRVVVRTHEMDAGEALHRLAVWWVLGSMLLKILYKGRMQAESLRRQVLEARMAMMQAQVEPHFLFNTLASIDHLIEFDPRRAWKSGSRRRSTFPMA